MPIWVPCACGKRFKASDRAAGKRVRCPACSQLHAVPGPDAAAGQEIPAPPAPRRTAPECAGKAGSGPLLAGVGGLALVGLAALAFFLLRGGDGTEPEPRPDVPPQATGQRTPGKPEPAGQPNSGKPPDDRPKVVEAVPVAMGEIRRLSERADRARAADLSADGRRALFAVTEDNTLRLLDTETGRELYRLDGHPAPIAGLALSADGRRALSGGGAFVLLWNLETGKELRRFEDPHNASDPRLDPLVSCVAFTPDGQRILIGGRDHVRLWRADDGAEVRRWQTRADGLAVSPDGKRLLTGRGSTLKLWDLEGGQLLRSIATQTSGVRRIAFSPDGRRALSDGSTDGGQLNGRRQQISGLHFWDLETGKKLQRFGGHWNDVTPSFSPDGGRAVVGGWTFFGSRTALGGWFENDMLALRVLDLETGKELHRLTDCPAPVQRVAFSPDGSQVLCACADAGVHVYDARSWQQRRRAGGSVGPVRALALAPDGRRAVSLSLDRTLTVWDVDSGQELRRLEGHSSRVTAIAFALDGNQLLSTGLDGTARLWDVATGKEVRRFKEPSAEYGSSRSLAFSPKGRRALSASTFRNQGRYFKELRLWDVDSGKDVWRHTDPVAPAEEWKPGDLVTGVAFFPDGRTAFSLNYNGTLRRWDAGTGKELKLGGPSSRGPTRPGPRPGGNDEAIYFVSFQPQKEPAKSKPPPKVYELAPVKPVMRTPPLLLPLKPLPNPSWHSEVALCVAVSADGRYALTGHGTKSGRKDGSVTVDDFGTVFASVSGYVKLWDVAKGQEVRRLGGHAHWVTAVAFSPDGRRVLSGSRGEIRLSETATGREVYRLKGHTGGITGLAFLPDGRRALSAGTDGTIRLWRLPDTRALPRSESGKGT